ncbi:hypothetical protein HDU76_012542 [Blyttiomyces sp. JEL0837]|nr:hypothetical protein HDU76_012542 [Blyttiomyces sp. JEL0837]
MTAKKDILCLGSSIPADTPHAVSVSLPLWKHNVLYEEGDPALHAALMSGYPRFVIHSHVRKLCQLCEKKFAQPSERCIIFPSRRAAEECRQFIQSRYPIDIPSTPQPKLSIRIAELTVKSDHHDHSFLASDPKLRHLGPVVLRIVIFPADVFRLAKSFWQHSGEGISSRFAEYCVKVLESNQKTSDLIKQMSSSGGNSAATPVAAKSPNNNGTCVSQDSSPNRSAMDTSGSPSSSSNMEMALDNGKILVSQPPAWRFQSQGYRNRDQIDLSRDLLGQATSSELGVYVEERYGRNFEIDAANEAKLILRRRIAGVLGDGDFSSDDDAKMKTDENAMVDVLSPNGRGLQNVNEDHVFLFPSGMSAIYNAHRIVTKIRPDRKTVQFGFPYLDTLKIQEKIGAGVYFLGHGSTAELETFEKQVLTEGIEIAALFCEFPSNPLLKCADLKKLRKLADEYGFLLVVDETIGNFVNAAVLEWADIVVSSLTKIFSGDCNVMGGSMIINPSSKFYGQIRETLNELYEDNVWGEDAIFLERNSRTFIARIMKINENAVRLATFLNSHPKVKKVHYPLFTDKETYNQFLRTENGYGGLLSVILENETSAAKFYDNLAVAKGPSLGTNFTLASPYTILAHFTELDWAKSFGVDSHLVRVSVGLEDSEDLVERFRVALEFA